MALIRTIDPAEASGELVEVYRHIAGASGAVANILRAESLAPRSLAAHYALYRMLMFGEGPLSRPQRELIAVAVSQTNGCNY